MSLRFLSSNNPSSNVGVGLSTIVGPTGPIGNIGPTGPQGNPGTAVMTGATGPAGPSFIINSFSTGALLTATSLNSADAHADIYYANNHLNIKSELEILNTQITGATAHQFVYNSFGYQTFPFSPLTGSNGIQTFTTDPLVNEVIIEAWGAGGGGGYGGNGGYSKTTISGLSGPHTFKVWVGDNGEGGRTSGQTYVSTIILASGPARYYDYFYDVSKTGYDSSIAYYVTGDAGNQTYHIGTVNGTGFIGSSPVSNPVVVGDQVLEWNLAPSQGSLTGTIFATGPYPYGGYTNMFLQAEQITIWGATGNSYIVVPVTGADSIPFVNNTGAAGGGASFVYMYTGSTYQLCNVAGGGGANSQVYGRPYAPNYFLLGVGGNSSSTAIDTSVQKLIMPYSVSSTIPSNVFGAGATGTQTGAPGTYNTGASSGNSYGGSAMPLTTSSVSSNVSATGGDCLYKNVEIITTYLGSETPFVTEDIPLSIRLNPNILIVTTLSGGGGGRGYAGGGGGGLYVSPDSIVYYSSSGYAGGGGGGSNYSYNGITLDDGFQQGNYKANIVQSGEPGYVRIQAFGFINPAFTVSSSGTTPTLLINQTPGFSMLEDGTSFFSKNVAIGKTNPEFLLDVEGDISTIGNIQISNFQNIFKSTSFDPVLYDIINNNFNYSNQEQTVSLNYSLASLSMNIGYLENALSGLGTMLGFAFGTYDDNGEIVDLPYWLKQWMSNYYPLSSSGLQNYVTSRQTSSTPSRSYYLQQERLLPFGLWVYYYCSYVAPGLLYGATPAIGIYIEDNKYYAYQSTGTASPYGNKNLQEAVINYMLNSVYATDNPYLLQQYNDPTGPYQFNIVKQAYTPIVQEYQLGVQNLVIYTQYTGADLSVQDIFYNYDPNSDYVNAGTFLSEPDIVYNPPSQPRYWYNFAFYDFGEVYTGTYADGVFVNDIRPVQGGTGFAMPFTFSTRVGQRQRMPSKMEIMNMMKSFSPLGVGPSTKTATLATIQPSPSTQALNITKGTNATQTVKSLAQTNNGPVKTTVTANTKKNGTNQGSSNNVSRGVSIP
jgi:hypothetical protein